MGPQDLPFLTLFSKETQLIKLGGQAWLAFLESKLSNADPGPFLSLSLICGAS